MEKRLYRIPRNKMIGGVCTGLGEYFSIDPVLVRLLFVILVFHQGVGILAYIILWIVVPMHPETLFPSMETAGGDSTGAGETGAVIPSSEGSAAGGTATTDTATASSGGRGTVIGGVVLIVIGVLFLFDNFVPGFDFSDFWPVLLIAIGTGMLWNSWPRKSEQNNNEVAS